MDQTLQLLDYLASYKDAVLTYHSSDIILDAHSDASYISNPKAHSRAGSHFFLSSNAGISPNNGVFLNISHTIKHVMVSAAKAKQQSLHLAREAVCIRIILHEL